MPKHTSHALNMQYVHETPNYHRLETKLPNGRIWYIYVPKAPHKNTKVYLGSFEPESVRADPPINDCGCVGPHYHAPYSKKKPAAKKSARKTTRTRR